MLLVLRNSWALLLGMFLLQVGNGMQGTVLGIRGEIEGFDPVTMGLVMSGYFVGFLGGAQLTPLMLRRVGHVRVFAALASLISAAFVIYALAVDPLSWTAMRLLVGFCYSGSYVVAESWLNNASTNQTRGQTLSAYLIAQMGGIILAQAVVGLADPGGYDLFILMSVAVSLACAPILLSASPTPMFEQTKPMSMRELYRASPLGCVGTAALGAVFACMFGMAAVWASARGLDTAQVSTFIGAIYLGGLLLQFPIGWLSDRMDRRRLIAATTAAGGVGALVMLFAGDSYAGIVAGGFIVGATSNPLYSLLIAHTNDFLDPDKMPAAAGGLLTLNGIGSSGTPVLVGFLMGVFGNAAFPAFLAGVFGAITLYALYRMTVRPAVPVAETLPFAPVTPVATAMEATQTYYAERAEGAAREEEAPDGPVLARADGRETA